MFIPIPLIASNLTQALATFDTANAVEFPAREAAFIAELQQLNDQLAAVKAKYAGTPVLATEPVFNYMAAAAGIKVVDAEGEFQKATQDGNDPPASAVARYREQLSSKAVKALIYNS